MIVSKSFHAFFLCILALNLKIVLSFEVTLDESQDQDKSLWKIEGNYEYLDRGEKLRGTVNKYLPDDFNFQNVGSIKGVWGIFPNLNNDCDLFKNWSFDDSDESKDDSSSEMKPSTHRSSTPKPNKKECDHSNLVSFRFKPVSRQVDSVHLKYWFGGKNATIRISSDKGKTVVLKSAKKEENNWQENLVKAFDGTSMLLEAMVGGKGDFILIDKISVDTPDQRPSSTKPTTVRSSTTSTTLSTTTTTTKAPTAKPGPSPSPVSGALGLLDLTPALATILFSLLFHVQVFMIWL